MNLECMEKREELDYLDCQWVRINFGLNKYIFNLSLYQGFPAVLIDCKFGQKAQWRTILRLFCICPRKRWNIVRTFHSIYGQTKYCLGKTEISWHTDQICISFLVYNIMWVNLDLVKFRRKELFWTLIRNLSWIVQNFKLRGRENKYIGIHEVYYSYT